MILIPGTLAIRSRLRTWVTALSLVCVTVSAGAAGEDTDPELPSISAESLEARPSYWGLLPARTDSVTQKFSDRRLPAWEYPIHGAFQVVALPVLGVQWVVTETLQGLDDLGVFRPVDPLLRGLPGPFGTRIVPNFRAGGLAGFGGGLDIHHRQVGGSPDNRFKLSWQATVKDATKVTLGLVLGQDPQWEYQFGAGYRKIPNARYFGLGPNTSPLGESFYTQETSWIGFHMSRWLSEVFACQAGVNYYWIANRGPHEKARPPLQEVYADNLPYGWGERSDGLNLQLALINDNTLSDGRPLTGGTRRLKASYFAGGGVPEASFWTFRGELEQFFPLWLSFRGLALRGAVTWIEAHGPVHFQRLLTNDDPDLLRGYDDFRFRDEGLLCLTAEYRWPILAWNDIAAQGVDAYLFTDIGQVFGEFADISLAQLTESYGFGLRLLGGDGMFAARLEVAFSEEDTVFRLRGDQIFQYAQRGLYHGRVPIPDR